MINLFYDISVFYVLSVKKLCLSQVPQRCSATLIHGLIIMKISTWAYFFYKTYNNYTILIYTYYSILWITVIKTNISSQSTTTMLMKYWYKDDGLWIIGKQ